MKQIEIYTSPLCGYCHAAKRLLSEKGVSFSEIDVSRDPERRAEMGAGIRGQPFDRPADTHGGEDVARTIDHGRTHRRDAGFPFADRHDPALPVRLAPQHPSTGALREGVLILDTDGVVTSTCDHRVTNPPANAELHLKPAEHSIDENVQHCLDFLAEKGFLKPVGA